MRDAGCCMFSNLNIQRNSFSQPPTLVRNLHPISAVRYPCYYPSYARCIMTLRERIVRRPLRNGRRHERWCAGRNIVKYSHFLYCCRDGWTMGAVTDLQTMLRNLDGILRYRFFDGNASNESTCLTPVIYEPCSLPP